jgi:phosphate transport system protein
MSKHLQHDLERLKKELLTMGALVENAINRAIVALVQRRPEIAEEVLAGDDLIDEKELEVEDLCLKMLALHQPVAGDLRFIVGCIKVNNDLERMGDLAQNIAERATYLARHAPIDVHADFTQMVECVRRMVADALDALVHLDTRRAREVCRADDEVDEYNRHMFVELENLMRRENATIERAVQTLSVSRHLERIADLATNVAEDVVFMVDGEVLRHREAGPTAAPSPAAQRAP